MNKVIKVFEYSRKELSEKDLTKKEIIAIDKLNETLKNKQNLKGDLLSLEYKKDRLKYLVTNNYVGVVKVGKKTIQIMPKMAKDKPDSENEHSGQAIRNLLYMLNYTKKLKIKETDLSSLSKTNDNFFEILIYLFSKNLLELIQNDVNKEYEEKSENLSFIKGKLIFSQHLKLNLVNKNRFYLNFDEFSEDNLLNQILKYTTKLLLHATNNFNNLKMLQELNFLFNDISPRVINVSDFNNLHLDRLKVRYEPIINLCKIFIGQSSLELSANKINTFSFIFDMNLLFEEFIGEFIKKNFPEYGNVKLQARNKYLVEEKYDKDRLEGRVFQLRPDIAIYNNLENPELIIDTKYKILSEDENKKGGVSQGDLYQMLAYSKKYKCKNIILLYPRLMGQHKKDIRFKIDDETNVFVRNIDLCKDLKIKKLELKEELAEILNIN